MNLAESSNLLDVGFTGVDGFPSIQSCVDALAKKHEIRAAPSASRRAPHVAQTNYSQYRYLLHLPGAATGSYSRNLQYLWTHGSIVLVWNQTATEFYYRHLQNDVHYVVVDASNIVETVEAIEADPARQERLRRGARAFYDAHLAAPRLIDRWRAVLEALALRQDVEPPKIDNSSACTCDHRLPQTEPCSTCLHLEDTEMACFMGILKKPKRPRAPDPDDVVGLARDILAATTLEAARAVARARAVFAHVRFWSMLQRTKTIDVRTYRSKTPATRIVRPAPSGNALSSSGETATGLKRPTPQARLGTLAARRVAPGRPRCTRRARRGRPGPSPERWPPRTTYPPRRRRQNLRARRRRRHR